MLATSKSLSLIEQKKLQWAREREELVGLCGLWGRPKAVEKTDSDSIQLYNKNNLLPPIQRKEDFDDNKEHYRQEEESETSGYLSDSPKHIKEKEETNQEYHYQNKPNDFLNNEADQKEPQQRYWNEVDNQEKYWTDEKMYKNYKNENWAQQNSESFMRQHPRLHQTNKNFWYGTPESVSSDDGSRLRWGDRGIGIGHLWEPVINHPDCRLPQVTDPYRQTPKWVERGLKNADGNKADILIIHHPDDDVQFEQPQKNFLLGQNVPIPPEVIEERERKRKKALEHQNAIKKQLEERELKRKQEKENRIREERLEEERIKKEQEIERLRYEEEQKKLKQKEELERKKEEAMREAIEKAEKRAREDKRRNKRHITEDNQKIEKVEQTEVALNNKRHVTKTARFRQAEEKSKKDQPEKTLKDSSSQFEDIQLANSFQFLNMNGLPVEGGLALMIDNPPKDNNFLLPPDGVQLALLMSPRNANSTNRLIPSSPAPSSAVSGERTLTPSKYRRMERMRFNPSNKSTQTDFRVSSRWVKSIDSPGRSRKQSKRCGTNSGSSGGSHKSSPVERHKHIRCFFTTKYRSKQLSSKNNLEDRPKWGINRPSVQYKKQSEKDPYYQKKIRERLRKAAEAGTSLHLNIKNEEKIEDTDEKELDSVVRLLESRSDEDKHVEIKEEFVLRNGYRMNSNLSSPVFVPISSRATSNWKETKKLELETERSRFNDSTSGDNEDANEEEETVVPGSVGYLTQTQLEAIKQITNLREGLKKLQKDYSNSRSTTPFSDKKPSKFLVQAKRNRKLEKTTSVSVMIKLDDFLTKKKEPAQVLDLSKVKITSKEEFKKYFDKIPECKVKPEKINLESVKIKDKEFSFYSGKREDKQGRDWSYLDPTPPDMKGVKLEDLCPVNIDWKMLTTLRPKTKVEEDMFSRLVQLGKLDLKHQQALLREKSTDWIRKTKNPKSSIVEMRVLSCKECGEDFCDSSMCSKLMYDNFFRPQPTVTGPSQNLLLTAETGEKKKKKKKKKKRKHKARKRSVSKGKRKKLGKNSIFNRPASRGCNRDHSRRTTNIVEKPRPRALSSTRSFSTERMRTSFFEERSKSAPRIHFECDFIDSKSTRYEFTSDSAHSHTEYSSQSDSESPDFHRRLIASRLRLSGRRKLLSARVDFVRKTQRGSSTEGSRSRFIRRCTLYKGHHSDASVPDSQNDNDSSSSCSTPSPSPRRLTTSAKYPSTIRIQFDESFSSPGLKFPEKIVLQHQIPNKKKNTRCMRSHDVVKIAEGFSKIGLELDESSVRNDGMFPRRPRTGLGQHVSRSRTTKLTKFSGPYLKAKGMFGKSSD